jgi:hypothetical protein
MPLTGQLNPSHQHSPFELYAPDLAVKTTTPLGFRTARLFTVKPLPGAGQFKELELDHNGLVDPPRDTT